MEQVINKLGSREQWGYFGPGAQTPLTEPVTFSYTLGSSIFAYSFSNLHNVQIRTDPPTHPPTCTNVRRKYVHQWLFSGRMFRTDLTRARTGSLSIQVPTVNHITHQVSMFRTFTLKDPSQFRLWGLRLDPVESHQNPLV